MANLLWLFEIVFYPDWTKEVSEKFLKKGCSPLCSENLEQ